MKNELVKIRAGIETVAYWVHGIFGAFFLLMFLEPEVIGLVLLFFPLAIPLVFVAIFSGLFSIQTAILSLLLIGILGVADHGPMINAYVLAWFFIFGFRIHRILMKRRDQAH